MKVLLIFAIGIVAVSAFPLEDVREEWEMIPDADGSFHLVNLKDAEFQASLNDRAEFPVRFLLYTKSNPSSPQEIIPGNAGSLSGSYFSASRQTRFLIHGWRGDPGASIGTLVRSAYLSRGDFNVIVVDWSIGAASINYVTAKGNVADAGRKVATCMNFLNSHGNSFNNMYVVGHSLGAHVSGFAGKYASAKPNTIFALDAALPLFNMNDPSSRLAASDAGYVEGIHTDTGRLGIDQPFGTSSFYPNWGGIQPGCGIDATGSCSHGRSNEYFAESLKGTNQFLAKKCGSFNEIQKKTCSGSATGHMGGDPSNHGVVGIYYLPTNSALPFATGRV